jgi:hypothetical protein
MRFGLKYLSEPMQENSHFLAKNRASAKDLATLSTRASDFAPLACHFFSVLGKNSDEYQEIGENLSH